jgi:hypothetical protein
MKHELPIPPIAQRDKNSREMIRAWVADEGLHCSLNVGLSGDGEGTAWGIVLSDVARHVSDAIGKGDRGKRESILAEIQAAFEREMEKPTSLTKGSFIE